MTDQANAPIDEASFATGYGMRMWYTAHFRVEVFEIDMPVCCRKAARGEKAPFKCPSCRTSWEIHSKCEQSLIEEIKRAINLISVGSDIGARTVLIQALATIGKRP